MRRIMRAFKIHEVSAVDRPAQAHAKVVLMKRNDTLPVHVKTDVHIDAREVAAALKRTFTAAERRSDAKSGAAMKDGSFPIENEGDLRNAMRLAGHAKNPSAARAHIRSRAKALGLTGKLSDAYKSEGNGLMKFLGLFKNFGVSTEQLSESVKSIVADETVKDKAALIDATFKQFGEHVEGEFEKTLSEGDSGDTSEEDEMSVSVAMKKALGLAETASDEEVLAALDKAKTDSEAARVEMTKQIEASKADLAKALEGSREGEIKKAQAEAEELRKSVAELKAERELALMAKRAAHVGIPESKAELLLKAYKGEKAAIDELLEMLKSSYAVNEESILMKEIGSNDVGPSDEVDALKAKAAELRKANPALTEEQAFAKVYSDPANKKLAVAERRANRPRAA